MANSISVAVGERDTILAGAASRVTEPLAPETVTGKVLAAEVDGAEDGTAVTGSEVEPPQAASRAAAATVAVAARVRPALNRDQGARG
jgi:hypothetical protein